MPFKVAKYFMIFLFLPHLVWGGTNRAAVALSDRLFHSSQNEMRALAYPKAFFLLSIAKEFNPEKKDIPNLLSSLPKAQTKLGQVYLQKGVQAYQTGFFREAKQCWVMALGFLGNTPSKERQKAEEYLAMLEKQS